MKKLLTAQYKAKLIERFEGSWGPNAPFSESEKEELNSEFRAIVDKATHKGQLVRRLRLFLYKYHFLAWLETLKEWSWKYLP